MTPSPSWTASPDAARIQSDKASVYPLTDAQLTHFEALDTQTAMLLLTRLAYSRSDDLGNAVYEAARQELHDTAEPDFVVDDLFPGVIRDARVRAAHKADIAARIEHGLVASARFAARSVSVDDAIAVAAGQSDRIAA